MKTFCLRFLLLFLELSYGILLRKEIYFFYKYFPLENKKAILLRYICHFIFLNDIYALKKPFTVMIKINNKKVKTASTVKITQNLLEFIEILITASLQ